MSALLASIGIELGVDESLTEKGLSDLSRL